MMFYINLSQLIERIDATIDIHIKLRMSSALELSFILVRRRLLVWLGVRVLGAHSLGAKIALCP